jgi:hypothetical protein
MARQRSMKAHYWCHPQANGHPTLYFRDHTLISRVEYIAAVGPDDCDPHIATGRRAIRKGGSRTTNRQRKRM